MKQKSPSENSETIREELNPKQQKGISPILGDFLAFERTCSSLTSPYLETFSLFIPLHTFLGFLLLKQHPLSPLANSLMLTLRSSPTLYHLFQIFVYLLNTLLIVALFGAKLKYKKALWFGSVKRIISLYSLLARGSLVLTALLLYIQFSENIAAAILSTTIALFDSLLVGNYDTKRNQNYQSSQKLSLIFRGIILLHVATNSLIVALGKPQIFCCLSGLFGVAILSWHLVGGYRLFFHKTARIVHRILISSLISPSLLYILLIFPRKQGVTFNFVEFGTAFTAVFMFVSMYEQSKRTNFIGKEDHLLQEKSLKQLELDLDILLEDSDESKSKEANLVGIMKHERGRCPNSACSLKQISVYDPILKQEFSTLSIVKEKESALRFYLKCIYDQALARKKTNERMLDFVEFSLVEMGDFSTHCFVLAELHAREESLGLLERLRLHRLRLILQEQSQAFNRLIYGGRIELDEVLRGEETFELILRDIDTYCRRSVEVWTDAMQREVDVGALKQKLRENFSLIPSLNEKWNSLAKFLNVQRHWKHAYLSFALFLKNEKLKNKDLSFNHENQSELATATENTPLSQQFQREQQVSDWVYFDRKATVIICDMEEGGLRFSKVSHSFESVTGYTEKEIRGSPLSMILPSYLQHSHDKMVMNWLNSGRTIDQNKYIPKSTTFFNKLSFQVPAIVIYKLYIQLICPQNPLKFISLIKSIQKGDEIEDINQNYSEITKKRTSTLFIAAYRDSKGAQNSPLTLNPSHNIFIKEETLLPSSTISQIQRTKQGMRLLTIVLLLIILWLCMDTSKYIKTLKDNSQAQIIFSRLYNVPFMLGKYYYSYIFSPAATTISPMIPPLSSIFKQDSTTEIVHKAIFSPEINLKNSYAPDQTNAINEGIVYDSPDIFYLISSCITTLSVTIPHPKDHEFVTFNSYIKPGYDQMMNSTKHQLHIQLQNNLTALKTKQIIFVVIASIVLLLTGIYLCFKVYNYFSRMWKMTEAIVQFNNTEIQKIIAYWERVAQHFRKMNKTKRNTAQQLQTIDSNIQNSIDSHQKEDRKHIQENATLNQKHKELVITIQEKRKTLKFCFLLVIFFVGIAPIVLVLQIQNISKLSQMLAFEKEGFYLIKHYPVAALAGYATMNRLYNDKINEPFNANRFQDIAPTLKLMTDYSFFTDSSSSSLYYQKRQNYLFGNPCRFNSKLLANVSTPLEMCESIAQRSFSNGILAYLRYAQPLIEANIAGTIKLSFPQLLDISIGLSLTGYYLEDAISTWQDQFNSQLEAFDSNHFFWSVLTCLLLVLIHIIVFELIIISNITKDYDFMKKVFIACAPEHILTQQKIIKHKFYQSGILKVN